MFLHLELYDQFLKWLKEHSIPVHKIFPGLFIIVNEIGPMY